MPTLATKPALAITAVAALVMTASGVSAAARAADATAGTTPPALTAGPHRGDDTTRLTALAKSLGVSVSDLQAAMEAIRDDSSAPDVTTDDATEAKTIADALGVDQSTIQKVLDAQKPTAHEGMPRGPRPGGAPSGTTPSGTTPTPPSTSPSGTTPPAGGPGGHGGGGRPGGASAEDTTLITAIANATGKDQTAVKAAVTKADAVRAAAEQARQTEFAKKLAAELHLDQDKVLTAVENARPAVPARAARTGTSQNG
ncbi:MAG: hypothetical protein AAGC46_17110 [Solirubrobacteraceae bacterium]|nr:hypothetical protein [Patulibacter sp.]